MADSSSVAFRYIEEVTRGTTPASALQILRTTGDGFKGTKSTMKSAELVGDAQRGDIIETGYGSVGELPGELSFGTYDEFITSAIRSADFGAETSVTDTSIAATATELTDSGSGLGSFEVGQFVKVSGFSASSLNRVYYVEAAAAGALGVYPNPATTESAGQSVTISGAVVKNGTETRSFSFEREHTDLTNVFSNWLGCRCGGMDLSFKAKDKVSVSFPFMGNTENVDSSTIGTGSPTAATSTKIMNAVSNLVIVGEGTTPADVTVTGATINITNPLRSQDVCGSTDPNDIGLGTVTAEGTISLYFANNDIKTKWLAHTQSALFFAFQDTAGNAYGVHLPCIYFADDDTKTPGIDSDIMENVKWEASKDATTGYTVHITKMAA